MKIANNIIGNILGKPRVRGGKNDWDGDGVRNKKDCQPRNTMRQDKWSGADRYRLMKDSFPGRLGDIILVDESGESSWWKNTRTGQIGSPFAEYNISERI